MQYANVNGSRLKASVSGTKGECPLCKSGVIAKCGSINIDHWAHISKVECESDKEFETAKHRAFKEQFPEHCREVVRGSRRADVLIQWKTPQYELESRAIEYQVSSISFEQIVQRTQDWNDHGCKVLWILDCEEKAKEGRISIKNTGSKWPHKVTYYWKWPSKTFRKAFEKDLNAIFYIKGVEENRLLRIRKFHTNKEQKYKYIEVTRVDENKLIRGLQERDFRGLQKHTA